ncbi:aconitase family protein [Vibrio chagasii]|nr:aconitase family protein [Vibrio chagasii]
MLDTHTLSKKSTLLTSINNPMCTKRSDDARLLSDVQGTRSKKFHRFLYDWHIGHFRAAGKMLEEFNGSLSTRLELAPPTKMDKDQLTEEGYYGIFGRAGVRIETPGCSLCMGNQARVADKSASNVTSYS